MNEIWSFEKKPFERFEISKNGLEEKFLTTSYAGNGFLGSFPLRFGRTGPNPYPRLISLTHFR